MRERTRVVNVRCERADVYIGRAGHGKDGQWGNPYRLRAGEASELVIERYRSWLWSEIRAGRVPVEELAALSGKSLGCFCKPAACHGDVLAAAAGDWAAAEMAGHGRGVKALTKSV